MWFFKKKEKLSSPVREIESSDKNYNWILLVCIIIHKDSRYSKPNPFREITNESSTIFVQSWRDSFIKTKFSKPNIKMSDLNIIRNEIANLNKVPVNSVCIKWFDYVIGDEEFLQTTKNDEIV